MEVENESYLILLIAAIKLSFMKTRLSDMTNEKWKSSVLKGC